MYIYIYIYIIIYIYTWYYTQKHTLILEVIICLCTIIKGFSDKQIVVQRYDTLRINRLTHVLD